MRYNITNSIHNKKSGVKLLGTMLALLLAGSSAVAQSIGGSVYGGGKGTSATVTGAVTVEVQAGTVGTDVYGGGALANTEGSTTVNLKGGTVTRNLYGGALGDDNVEATVSGAVQVTVSGGEVVSVFGCNNIKGAPQSTVQVDIEQTAGTMAVTNVYGGGNQAAYSGSPVVNIKKGTVSSDVFGGGLGNSATVTGNPQVTVSGALATTQVNGGVYGGGSQAPTVGNPTVTLTNGTVANVYGGGKAADVTGAPIVYINGGAVTTGVYGGCNSQGNITQAIQVNANGGTIKDVYGGGYGYQTTTGDNVTVTINGSTISGDVYGGSALGQVNDLATETTKVWLKTGSIAGNIYGGGEGQAGEDTYGQVNGKVEVLVQNGSVNNVYGCNNKNGAPQQTVKVDIEGGTVNTNVYGGGNLAAYSAGSPEVNIKGGIVKQSVFGGGNQAGVGIANGITKVNLTAGSVGSDGNELYGIYGGCNEEGTVTGDIQVNITSNVGASDKKLKGIFGGGYGSVTATAGKVDVTIGSNSAEPVVYGDVYGGSALGSVNGTEPNNTNYTHVTMKKGTVHGDLYGGGLGQKDGVGGASGNIEAKVFGPVLVKVENGTVDGNVFGCNNLNGSPKSTLAVEITGGNVNYDVYGGGNLASASCNPQIDILGGSIAGNVFGGGLGQDSPLIAPSVGAVTVNIGGAEAVDTTTGEMTNPSGAATIGGSVYGCNNRKGSPTGNVTVNIYQTKHTDATQASTGTSYAIDQVFGGGKNASYTGSWTATVNIWGCDNTIRRVFGGGDAAAAPNVETNLYGGRFDYVFGGGNGESSAADITGDVNLNIHGGRVNNLYGGSNTSGTIGGETNVLVDHASSCNEYIAEFFGGGNMVPITGNVNTTIGCGTTFGDVYGGSNQANITGNVTIAIKGGTMNNVFGGSKGVTNGTAANILDDPGTQEREGNVTLNLYGGNIGTAFGGSNYNGNIEGVITVNVLDHELSSPCEPLSIGTIYGAGNLTAYTPKDVPTGVKPTSPIVNVMHIKKNEGITGNVYGGAKGSNTSPATVTSNPQVTIGYGSDLAGYIPATGFTVDEEDRRAVVAGNIYGGGDLSPVVGSTTINIQNVNTSVGNDVYGGGNKANVSGSVIVNVKGGTIANDVYGGGALADVNVTSNALTPNATTTVNLTGGTVTGNVYGGGLGQLTPESIAAKVYGQVQVNAIGGNIGTVFGCNNLNGAPQSTVQVTMEKSMAQGAPELNINNVYGGGNQAPYSGNPVVNIKNGNVVKQGVSGGNVFGGGLGASATVTGNPQLTIGDIADGHEGYHAVVEGSAYGGGDAAPVNGVPVVLVQKCNTEVGLVYGGGNAAPVNATNITVTGGDVIGEVYGGCYGADVAGNSIVNIQGGTINQVYGGNNASGTISGEIHVTVNKDANACEMHIGEVYGGGNHADSQSNDDQIVVSCTGGEDEGINYVYGGANEADVTGDITLNITDGRIANVFGGNNTSGTISGSITVNINKKANPCGWNIGNVYGGGNQATYGTAGNNYPEVNIKNGTVSGDVFGGGLGDANDDTKGVVTGNPQVTINGAGAAVTGGVYGGGSLAPTNGNAVVTLTNGALTDVYGGGKAANVNGAPTVYINGGSVSHGVFGGCNTSGTVRDAINVYINGGTVGASGTPAYGVFGGGYGAGTETGDNVTVTIGNDAGSTPTIYGPVYGGSAKGNVNDNSNEITKLWLKKGSITGDIYGGGFGDGVPDAKVNGKVQVVVYGGSVTGSVYGCNNAAGAPQSTVNVDVYTTTGISEVFGGGNQAAYTGTPVVKIHNNNTIGNVYGGGNAAAVAGTDVTVYGGAINNVFGGCYGAPVTGGTDVKIHGGTIGKVFGANNSDGSVTGDIQVTIDKQGDSDPQGTSTAPEMHITEVYGGGNLAASHAGTITVRCTGDAGEGITDLYGGANDADISGDILVEITEGRIQNVYGGNNTGHSISGNITVNINEKDGACGWSIGNVYGGGNKADFANQASVNIKKGTISHCVYGGGNQAGVGSSIVTLTDGLITEGLYGGCNTSGTVTGDIILYVNGGQVGVDADHKANIYGGGYGESTHSHGDVTVNFGAIAAINPEHTAKPEVFGDIYGGSALGEVNGTNNTTTVNILNGVINGNIYGGGHGRLSPEALATVYGNVVVNIGLQKSAQIDNEGIGYAYLEHSTVYGSNNINGSPQKDVTVNIWKNGLCDDPQYNSQTGDDPYYSIDQVFGGGNRADFDVTIEHFTNVFVHDCSNAIRRVFGGSDASAAYGVNTTINGGRFDCVYGGGNGESIPADIGNGGVHLTVTAGIVNQLYGGSNQSGANTGGLYLNVSALSSGDACKEDITEIFCGGNYANVTGNVITTIDCSEGLHVDNLYGGCNHACVKKDAQGNGGNIVLTVKGGTFKNVYGGSKGQRDGYTEGKRHHRESYSADVEGNITLNIYGGTIENVYGGSNILGRVNGTITVNLIDHDTCVFNVGNVYGGGNMTDYEPNYATSGERISPMVNIMHGTVNGNVYGGAKGSTQFGATITSSPRVIIGYDNSMSTLVPAGFATPTSDFRATVKGDIYGGGDAAVIDGNTEIQLRNHSKVRGNIYGGGNMGEVKGNTKVIVDGKGQ